ncbi:MAG: hypothetical protein DHS80DRAFT_12464 [Piptocephalis tieghemiana]|nr:MAG: hypothetical protein DHS80DRAFT_12464 [Piptocephalis tieghemiana]
MPEEGESGKDHAEGTQPSLNGGKGWDQGSRKESSGDKGEDPSRPRSSSLSGSTHSSSTEPSTPPTSTPFPLDSTHLPQLRYTTIPPGPTPLPSRPAASKYMRGDRSYFLAASGYRPTEPTDTLGPPSPQTTVVLHPGSRALRLGLASDTLPHSVPQVIVRYMTNTSSRQEKNKKKENQMARKEEEEEEEKGEESKEETTLQAISHRRPNPQALSLVRSYNTSASPELIPDRNDPYRIEWIHLEGGEGGRSQVVTGNKALYVAEGRKEGWVRRWPWSGRGLNLESYTSVAECLGDLGCIWEQALESSLGITRKSIREYSVVLVVNEQMDRSHLSRVIDLLLQELGFSRILITMESVAATFGAGTSTACVLDLGATTTSVACVEDGMVLPGTALLLPYGGDDGTRMMAATLEHAGVTPQLGLGLSRPWEWMVVESLKETLGTVRETEVGMQVASATVRTPAWDEAKKWHIKVCDEVMLPMLLFFVPEMLQSKGKSKEADTSKEEEKKKSKAIALPDPPDKAWSWTVEEAIGRCIRAAGSERAKRLYGNILCVGGGSLVQGFGQLLEERLASTSSTAVATPTIRVISSSRDMDPRVLSWKGGSVQSRLECTSEQWCRREEWMEARERCVIERSTFLW